MMKKQRINVAAALDSNYFKYTCVMLTSLFENQSYDLEIHIFLLQSDLLEWEKEYLQELIESYGGRLHWLNVNTSVFPKELPLPGCWPVEIYYRLMLQDILPEDVEKILYLDVDTIVNKPLDELFNMDFEGKMLCACCEPFSGIVFDDFRNEIFKEQRKEGYIYFNSGVLLLDIKSIKEKYSLKDYLEVAKRLDYKLITPDQDILNYVHWKEVKIIDASKYNLYARFAYNCGVSYEEIKKKVTIIHFLEKKPWDGKADRYNLEQLWWDYAEMTPFYEEIAEKFLEEAANKNL